MKRIARMTLGFMLSATCVATFADGGRAERLAMQACTGVLIDHTHNYLQKIIAGASQNMPMGRVSSVASTNAPFKKGTALTCEQKHLEGDMYAYQCSGTFGSPCGFVSNRSFVCDFVDDTANQAIMSDFSDDGSVHQMPSSVNCYVCINWKPDVSESTKDQAEKTFQHHGKSVSILTIDMDSPECARH